jgi:hypothetical protein
LLIERRLEKLGIGKRVRVHVMFPGPKKKPDEVALVEIESLMESVSGY